MAKILFVSGWYPTPDKPAFGIFVRRHAEAASLTNRVSVLYVRMISSSEKKLITTESAERNNLFEVIISINKNKLLFPPFSFILKLFFYCWGLIKGYKIIASQRGKPDLVHANILYEGGRQALLLKLFYRISYLCTEQWTGYLPQDGTYRGIFKKLISKLAASQAKFILPITNLLARAMQLKRLKGNYRIIPNVVNTNIFRPSSATSIKEKQFIHISSLDERQKNFAGILDGFKMFCGMRTDFRLLVAGGGENIPSVKQMAEQRGIPSDKIYFAGHLNEDELVEALHKSMALILFSNYETQGCVVLESLACGTPVIASNLEVIREMVREDCGMLVEPGDAKMLSEAMNNLVEHYEKYSPEKLHGYMKENYSYEKINEMLNEIYKEATEKKKN